jgi:hypothetical protein
MNNISTTVSNSYVTCSKLKIKQYPSTAPIIYDWSYYYDTIQNQIIITIIGANFRYFSRVQLGNYNIEVIYISSTIIQVNVPRNITTGVYTLQVINDNIASNSVNYTQLL